MSWSRSVAALLFTARFGVWTAKDKAQMREHWISLRALSRLRRRGTGLLEGCLPRATGMTAWFFDRTMSGLQF